ncbi:TetR family transcriptional regulator [Kribbella sandramycini]|uniref:AcrR family transcriptional regulator n=1 Tax=Kribbella sandramycini TaxID=60450 RepID=A0A7Y4L1Y3_9ACTN|nr:TetR family transcriptional regulator C-terminal domain-containing protein [Kribbella sandramycini]MBB6566526.1 AcrR family transcriptional regulator [Kribbella sandramycini]NOL42817.1 TetR family transcriptional regulator [Kribbella sandramycini]
MPRVVDVDERRALLAAAVWRVIHREGLANASVRKVAAEAQVSMGSLRHYFSTQNQLLQFSLQAVGERVTQRLATLDLTGTPRQVAELVALELLPLDADRRAEVEIWIAFSAATLTDPDLRALSDQSHEALHTLLRTLVADLLPPNSPDQDLDLETDRLHALIDGLALHGATTPTQTTPTRLQAALTHHLEHLARS